MNIFLTYRLTRYAKAPDPDAQHKFIGSPTMISSGMICDRHALAPPITAPWYNVTAHQLPPTGYPKPPERKTAHHNRYRTIEHKTTLTFSVVSAIL